MDGSARHPLSCLLVDLVGFGGRDAAVPLVEGWGVIAVAEISVPLVVGGCADLIDLGADVNYPLVLDVRIRHLRCKQFACWLQTFPLVLDLAGCLGDALVQRFFLMLLISSSLVVGSDSSSSSSSTWS